MKYVLRARHSVGQILIGDSNGCSEEVVCVRQVDVDRWEHHTVPTSGTRRVGYARVSTSDQTHALQVDALEAEGVDAIFLEQASGAGERPELSRAVSHLREGDQLWVWELDRLGRKAAEVIELLDDLGSRGVAVKTCSGPEIDPSTPVGMAMCSLLAVFADMERRIILKRSRAGIEAAQKRGTHCGRPPALSRAQKQLLWDMRSRPTGELAELFDCSVRTIQRRIKELKAEHGE